MDELNLIYCSDADLDILASLNKQLIEDEQSDNKMNVAQLKERMHGFIHGEYSAYLFKDKDTIVGYALVKNTQSPIYLRQFFICREHRKKGYGTLAFNKLLEALKINTIDIEVLCWNKPGKSFWDSLGFKERSIYMRLEK